MKIAFVYPCMWPYIQKDIDILKSVHDLRECRIPSKGRWDMSVIKDLGKLWADVMWCDVVFCWFGKLHTLFALIFSKVLGKKIVVVSGGDDVGMYFSGGKARTWPAHPVKKYLTYFIFKNISKIISISEFNHMNALSYARADSAKTVMIYHGFDSCQFQKPGNVFKENIVATVVTIGFEKHDRKGVGLFIECARFFPEIKFMIIGPSVGDTQKELEKIAPDNVVFTGPLYGNDLINILSRVKVYVQASEWESFGCAVAEAMLCECVPVVSRLTALHEVVGEAGYYIDNLTPEGLSETIHKALADREMGVKARERIIHNFSFEKRSCKLLAVLEGMLPSTS